MQHDPAKLTTTREVVTALGGTKAVATLTGRRYSAVSNWLLDSKGKFPSNTYVILNASLAAIGKSAPPSLWGMKLQASEAAA